MTVKPAASYWSATADVGKGKIPNGYRSGSASYWSATADVGKQSVGSRDSSGSASYWSASADIGRPDRVSLGEAVAGSVYYNRRAVPYVANRGDAGSAYRAQQTIAALQNQRSASSVSTKLKLGDDRALNNQDDFFVHLRNRLATLSKNLERLSFTDAFNPYKATSNKPHVVDATAAIYASDGKYEITVERKAQAHQIASDQQSDVGQSLNLSGSFSINGYSITVETTDTLLHIRDKINRGEDTNENGELETRSEDANGNGTLDHYYSSGVYAGNGTYLASFNYYEDIDADGVIDGPEDDNSSDTLDGGFKQTAAKAEIQDNRLVIVSMQGADKKLSLTDSDDILDSLGFFKRGTHNGKILATTDENEYVKEPKTALFTINGKSFTANENTVDGAIRGVTLILKSTTVTRAEISVTRDASGPVKQLGEFADAFNSVVLKINDENIGTLQQQDNVRVQDFAISLARSAHNDVISIPKPPRSLADIGMPPNGSSRLGMDISALEGLESGRGANGLVNTAGGASGLFSKLDKIGISSRDDFTLTMDRDKLAEKIENDPVEVYSVFNKQPDGVANRIKDRISYANSRPNGMIEYQRNMISHYKKNPADAANIISKDAANRFTTASFDLPASVFNSIEKGSLVNPVKA